DDRDDDQEHYGHRYPDPERDPCLTRGHGSMVVTAADFAPSGPALRRCLDELAVGTEDVPHAVDALAVDVSGAHVADVVVQRPVVVGGLGGTLGAGGLRQERLVGTGAGRCGLAADQRRPGGDTRSGTGTGAVLVVGECVEGAPVLVGQDRPEAGLLDLHLY